MGAHPVTRWRARFGISLLGLARRAGIHHRVLQRIEAEGADARASTVAKIIAASAALGAPLELRDFLRRAPRSSRAARS